jgi:hypothetical protein
MTIVGPMPCKGCGERVKVAITIGRPLVLDEWLERRHRCPVAKAAA